MTLGSADSDSFRYDPNTGRMTQYAFTVGSTPQTEAASLYWNASGTLNLLAIIDPFNSADTQTCSYGYDGLARVSGVGCGGETNLLNPGFELGNVDWTSGGGWTIVNNASNAQSGSWYLSGTSTTDTNEEANTGGVIWGSVAPGNVLHYGGWIERVGAGTGNIWWSCEVVDTNHSHIGWCPVAGLTDGSGGTSWGYYDNSYTVPAGGAYARFYAEIHGGGDSDVTSTTGYFDTATFTSTASTWQQTFTYDPFGNITKTGNSAFQPSYSTAKNQITTTGVHYDGSGNLLTDNLGITYTWTGYGSPASINSTNLIYDAFGRMVEQQTGSAYTQILYSPAGKTAIMNGQTLNKAFVYLPGGETAIYNSSGLAYYRHSDWLGSSRLTTTASRTVYSDSAYAPFGEQYAPSGTTDASFTGQNADTTSALYDFTFRELSPSQGRWISPDPAGLSAVYLTSPQSWNRYAYVLNNPVALIDPAGLELGWNICFPDDLWCVWQTGPGGPGGGPSGPGGGVGGNACAGPNAPIPCANAANNGPPKSPARQQCEQKAQQQFQQAKSAAATNAFTAAKYTFFVTEGFNAAAGCAIGAGVGAAFGTTVAEFTGGTSSFGGAGVGCFTGGVDMALNGLAPAALWGAVGGTISYLVDRNAAKNDYNQAMQACSQIP